VSGEAVALGTDVEDAALVLQLLAETFEADGGHLSGAAIADKLGLSRQALLQQLNALRALGFSFQALPGSGYKLVGVPDALDAAVLQPLLGPLGFGQPVHSAPELPSTNDEAHRLAAEGAPHGALVVADAQSQGRGRRGRSWVTPPGTALAFTLVLRPELPPARAPELQLAAAVAVCEAARALGAARAAIKWPNDVECGGRKLSGLLAELRTSGDRLEHVVLGVGLNVNLTEEHLPVELRETATSLLLERGEAVPRAWVLFRLVERLDHWLGVHERFEPVRARWRELSSTLGRSVRIESGTAGDAAGQGLHGEAVDLAEDGALLVRDEQGVVHRISAGDVVHLRTM
jgi:BirA family biotin operon repressor/biotin-[acetyl-CoA-carboxylase] ligase